MGGISEDAMGELKRVVSTTNADMESKTKMYMLLEMMHDLASAPPGLPMRPSLCRMHGQGFDVGTLPTWVGCLRGGEPRWLNITIKCRGCGQKCELNKCPPDANWERTLCIKCADYKP
eukprot:jgi/Mesvir1/4851/Mv11127-RA.1